MSNQNTIPVTIGKKVYQTYIASSGVQRFVPDPLVHKLQELNLIDLNAVALEYAKGKLTLDDMIDLNTRIDYSVDGFCDLSYANELKIENPLWK